MKALLKPPTHLAHKIDARVVGLVARTGRRKIKVEFEPGVIRAVERERLFSETDRYRRLAEDELRALPWQGAGPDPDRAAVGELLEGRP